MQMISHAALCALWQVNGPSVYTTYLMGAQRLGLSEGASGYWALHIKEDERHGRQMVADVALPLADMCAHTLLSPCPCATCCRDRRFVLFRETRRHGKCALLMECLPLVVGSF